MKKTLLAIFSLLAIAVLAGCSKTTATSANDTTAANTKEDLVVWVDEKVVEQTETMINAFFAQDDLKEFADLYNVKVTAMSESKAASQMELDVANGADVFAFAQDQLARLVEAGAVTELIGTIKEEVTAANDASSITAATLDSKLYAYPLTSDNGYFMYYDKSVITDEIKGSLEDIVKACEDNNKYFAFQLGTDGGWYAASFFFAAGCHSDWTTDEDGAFVSFSDDFYDETKGTIACTGMSKLVTSTCWVNASSVSQFNQGAAVVVSGTWDYADAVTYLGENFGVAELPSFTVGETSYHLGSFSGNKLFGVKPQTDATKAAVCQRLAQWLTNKDNQLARYQSLGWGPSNKEAQADEAVQSAPQLVALAAQGEYAVPQGQFPDAWWSIMASVAPSLQSGTEISKCLSDYHEGIASITAERTEDEYVLTGSWNSWNNLPLNNEYNMAKTADGIYEITVTITEPGSESTAIGRITTNGTWNSDLGANILVENEYAAGYGNSDNNIMFNVAGTFKVTLDISNADAPTITITKVEE